MCQRQQEYPAIKWPEFPVSPLFYRAIEAGNAVKLRLPAVLAPEIGCEAGLAASTWPLKFNAVGPTESYGWPVTISVTG